MSKFRQCAECGAALDPGEICDCRRAEAETGQILALTQAPIIYENLSSVEENMTAIRQHVYSLPLTEDSLREVKNLRAQIRKEFDGLEDQRKAVKKAVMEPYDKAEAVYKACVSTPFHTTDGFLKAWIDGYQDNIKIQCENRLKEYFAELCQSFNIDFLRYEDCGVRVDMTLARQKEPRKAMDQIYTYVMGVRSDLDTILKMEDAEEIMAEYRCCPILASAIGKVTRRKADLENTARFLENQRRQRDRQTVEQAAMIEAAPEIQPEPEEQYSVCFKATGTLSALKAMKAHAIALGITFEEIDQEEENNE